MSDDTTPAQIRIPPAIVHAPTCPVCDQELIQDEDWECLPCELIWDSDDLDALGEFIDPAQPRCGEEHRPYDDDGYTIGDLFAGAVYRCIRPQGHESECAGVKVAGRARITDTLTWRTKRVGTVDIR